MNEQTQKKYFYAIFFVFALVVSLISAGPILGLDIFWHIRLGLDLLQKGQWPLVDHYSVDAYLEPYLSQTPWLYQGFVASSYSLFGLLGIKLSKLLLVLLPGLGAFVLVRRDVRLSGTMAIFLLVVGIAFVSRPYARPDLLAFAFSMALVALHIQRRGRFDRQYFMIALAIQSLWSLYHSSAVVGLAFLGATQLGYLIDIYRGRQKLLLKWPEYLSWNLLLVISAYINLQFKHYLFTISDSNLLLGNIDEFQPLYDVPLQAEHLLFYAMFLFSLYVALKKRWPDLAILTATFFAATVLHERMVPISLVLVGFYLAYSLRVKLSRKWFLTSIAVSVVGLAVLPWDHLQSTSKLLPFNERHPVKVLEVIADPSVKGNLLTELGFSSYAMFRLGQKNRLYFDGRVGQIYSAAHIESFYEKLCQPKELAVELSKGDLEFAVASESIRPDRLLDTLVQGQALNFEVEADGFYLFSKRSTYSELTKLMSPFPEALVDVDRPKLKQELEALDTSGAKNAMIARIGQAYLDFTKLSLDEQKSLLPKIRMTAEMSLVERRFLAVFGLSLGLGDKVLSLYRGAGDMGEFGRIDTYRLSLWLAKMGNNDSARRLLERIQQSCLSAEESRIYYGVEKAVLRRSQPPAGVEPAGASELAEYLSL